MLMHRKRQSSSCQFWEWYAKQSLGKRMNSHYLRQGMRASPDCKRKGLDTKVMMVSSESPLAFGLTWQHSVPCSPMFLWLPVCCWSIKLPRMEETIRGWWGVHFAKTLEAVLWSQDCPAHQHCTDLQVGSGGPRCELQNGEQRPGSDAQDGCGSRVPTANVCRYGGIAAVLAFCTGFVLPFR